MKKSDWDKIMKVIMKKIDEATPEQLKETLNFLNSLETARNDSFTAPLEDLKKQSNELKKSFNR